MEFDVKKHKIYKPKKFRESPMRILEDFFKKKHGEYKGVSNLHAFVFVGVALESGVDDHLVANMMIHRRCRVIPPPYMYLYIYIYKA